MIDKYKKIECNGCQMCAEICPKQAISYKVDDTDGFWYPSVDYDKCVSCGLCVKRCPNKTKINFNRNLPIVKAIWSKEDDVRLASTSGGLFYELAKYTLENNGYVCGCEYDKDFKGAHHTIIHSMDDLPPLMVSKYVESDINGVYPQIKELLLKGEKVLFVGAPCQCAGLQSYLNKKYDNLIVVDFLCRGANSPKAHRKYVEYLENKYGGKMIALRSKDKRNGWERFGQSAIFDNGAEYFAPRSEDLRIVAYHRGNLMERESCNDCKFKELPRTSDITLGDFWGIKADEVKDIDKGISLCFINSEVGQSMINNISSRIEMIDKTLEDAERGNVAIHYSAPKGKNRDAFLANLDNMPFDKLVEKYKDKDPGFIKKCYRKFKRIVKKVLGRE